MTSLDALNIPVVPKQNTSLRNEGGSLVTTSGLAPQQGPTSIKTTTVLDPQPHDRDVASFGTQVNETTVQYSTLNVGRAQKVTTSDDASLTDGDISFTSGGPAPTATSQPEIANKPISQRSAYNTGNRIVISDSDSSSVVERHSND
jgi:hypothetical protein